MTSIAYVGQKLVHTPQNAERINHYQAKEVELCVGVRQSDAANIEGVYAVLPDTLDPWKTKSVAWDRGFTAKLEHRTEHAGVVYFTDVATWKNSVINAVDQVGVRYYVKLRDGSQTEHQPRGFANDR